MLRKKYKAAMEFKEDPNDLGQFKAVFATLNVKDHDGDVTLPGAFREGQEAIVEPWNHSWDLPAGKGRIHSDGQQAWIAGKFFLDTVAGRENYRTVKNLGPLAEWSYTFVIEESKMGEFEGENVQFLQLLDTVGVSPVTRGAGIDTGTQSIKGKDDEPSADGSDEAGANPEGEIDGDKPSGDLATRINLAEISVINIGVENG